jgi:hypothetical protein
MLIHRTRKIIGIMVMGYLRGIWIQVAKMEMAGEYRDRPVNALYRGDRFAGYAADAA